LKASKTIDYSSRAFCSRSSATCGKKCRHSCATNIQCTACYTRDCVWEEAQTTPIQIRPPPQYLIICHALSAKLLQTSLLLRASGIYTNARCYALHMIHWLAIMGISYRFVQQDDRSEAMYMRMLNYTTLPFIIRFMSTI
jgi:hypothetical protein